jgi:hypothetical protein
MKFRVIQVTKPEKYRQTSESTEQDMACFQAITAVFPLRIRGLRLVNAKL